MTTTSALQLTQTHDYYIRATPERVWQGITDGHSTQRYFYGSFLTAELTPGGAYVFTAGAGGPMMVAGRVRAVEPARLLAHSWTVHYDPTLADESSEVEWRLEPQGEVTRVRLVHRLDGAPKTAAHLADGGWGWVLSSLKTMLETGEPLPRAAAEAMPDAAG